MTTASCILASAPANADTEAKAKKTSTDSAELATTTATTSTSFTANGISSTTPASQSGPSSGSESSKSSPSSPLPTSRVQLGPRKRTNSFSVHNIPGEPLRKYQKKMGASSATIATKPSTATTTVTTLTMTAPLSTSEGLRRCASYASLNTLATYSPSSGSSNTEEKSEAEVPYKRSLRYQLDQRNRRRAIAACLPPGRPVTGQSMLTFPSSSSSATEDATPSSEAPPASAPPALQDHAIPLKLKCKVSRKSLPPITIPTSSRPAPPTPTSLSSQPGPQPVPSIRYSCPPPPPCVPLRRPLSPLIPETYSPDSLGLKKGPNSAFFATFPNPRRPRSRPEANWVKIALCTRVKQTEEGRKIMRFGPRKAIAMGLLRVPEQEQTFMDFDDAWKAGEETRQSLGLCTSGMSYGQGFNGNHGIRYISESGYLRNAMNADYEFDLSEATRELEELVRDQDRRNGELGLFEMDVDEEDEMEEDINKDSSSDSDSDRVPAFSSPYLSPTFTFSSPSLTLNELNTYPFTSSSPLSPSSSSTSLSSLALECPPSPALTFASSDSFSDSDSSSSSEEEDEDDEDRDADGEPDPDVFMFDAPAWPGASFTKSTKPTSSIISHTHSTSNAAFRALGKPLRVKRKAVKAEQAIAVVEEEEGSEKMREEWSLVAYPFANGLENSSMERGWEVVERSQTLLEVCA